MVIFVVVECNWEDGFDPVKAFTDRAAAEAFGKEGGLPSLRRIHEIELVESPPPRAAIKTLPDAPPPYIS